MKKKFWHVFEKTQGRCHLCHGSLVKKNYGKLGQRGAWEVDHSKAKTNGGTSHLNNLFPAHTSCNRSKQDKPTRSVRSMNGLTRAPLSKAKVEQGRHKNAVFGGVVGGIFWAATGPLGLIVGVVAGSVIGHAMSDNL